MSQNLVSPVAETRELLVSPDGRYEVALKDLRSSAVAGPAGWAAPRCRGSASSAAMARHVAAVGFVRGSLTGRGHSKGIAGRAAAAASPAPARSSGILDTGKGNVSGRTKASISGSKAPAKTEPVIPENRTRNVTTTAETIATQLCIAERLPRQISAAQAGASAT
ncbi:hypothetical protein ACFV2H_44570 [Streptomyces sp. NPDC059629]|uniref:hypothetical protein n=1 Tax=Streptomyces sp. NPDC059629 TaxID=3346889 RepID=UPI00368CD822